MADANCQKVTCRNGVKENNKYALGGEGVLNKLDLSGN